MAVIKEWHCGACGLDFDSELPICGRCGSTDPYVARAFRTPPGFKSDGTKLKDTSLQNFTSYYGLSDFTNNESQKHEKKYMGLDGKPISVNDMWMENKKGVVASAPDPGESRADLLKSFATEAAKPLVAAAKNAPKAKEATR